RGRSVLGGRPQLHRLPEPRLQLIGWPHAQQRLADARGVRIHPTAYGRGDPHRVTGLTYRDVDVLEPLQPRDLDRLTDVGDELSHDRPRGLDEGAVAGVTLTDLPRTQPQRVVPGRGVVGDPAAGDQRLDQPVPAGPWQV